MPRNASKCLKVQAFYSICQMHLFRDQGSNGCVLSTPYSLLLTPTSSILHCCKTPFCFHYNRNRNRKHKSRKDHLFPLDLQQYCFLLLASCLVRRCSRWSASNDRIECIAAISVAISISISISPSIDVKISLNLT